MGVGELISYRKIIIITLVFFRASLYVCGVSFLNRGTEGIDLESLNFERYAQTGPGITKKWRADV